MGSPAQTEARNLTKDTLSLFPLPDVGQDVPGTPLRRSKSQEQCQGLVKGSLLAPAVPAGGGNSREVGGGLVRLCVRLHSVLWQTYSAAPESQLHEVWQYRGRKSEWGKHGYCQRGLCLRVASGFEQDEGDSLAGARDGRGDLCTNKLRANALGMMRGYPRKALFCRSALP